MRNIKEMRNIVDWSVFSILLATIIACGKETGADTLGLPADDPVVEDLQSRFSQATTPTPSDLQLGKTWRCHLRDAYSSSNHGKDHRRFFLFVSHRTDESLVTNLGRSCVAKHA